MTPPANPIVASDATALLNAGGKIQQAAAAIHCGKSADDRSFVILTGAHGAQQVVYLEKSARPAYQSGTVHLHDAPSFIAYITRMRKFNRTQTEPAVYAHIDPNPAGFVAVLDEHDAYPDWRNWRAAYALKHSAEWAVWTQHNGEGATFGSTTAFAKFLEDNAPDIVEPAGAIMQEVALNFRINSEVTFANAQRLQDGNVELLYNNVVEGHSRTATGKKIGIPERFKIRIPVWVGIKAKPYDIDARFRYRLRDSKLTLWYELVRPRKVLEQAFADTWGEIEAGLKLKILHGTPE